ncbi:FAD protein [Venustampulla echinocandica]|uniref:FAD protein n=1 Tax=Venustampulla echinocandica TaxID=2656787 RepID=A0A370TUM1_9HELO|nr:FAD protein [Venustampulla echinocandica]RDL39216.1 FAD protein [Venustampulla echinocandica]
MDSLKKFRTRGSVTKPKIGIIGAGIAGLRCADILLQHGFNVTILEGRDRIGGRAHQAPLPSGQLVDLGPNWIHGTDQNPIHDLAKETKTTTHLWGEALQAFDKDGKKLEQARLLSDDMWGIILQAFKHSAQNTSTIDPEQSLHDFFVEKTQEMYPGGGESEHKRKIVMQMSELWGAFVGSDVRKQSLKFFWLEECIDGGTYKDIVALIAKPAKGKADIKLSTKINHINTTNQKVTLVTENGVQLEFDEVVVTSPLGWLKNNKHTFEPPLPARFSQAIDSIGYGTLEKVYITFPTAFWLNGDVGSHDYSSGFAQWLSPSYALDTNPQRWNQEAVDMASLPGSCSHPTMLFYLYGDHSISLTNELAALRTEKARQEYLIEFFEPYFSLLPHYYEKSKDCIPVYCLATSWATDELAGNGSYSNFQTGLKEGDKDIEIMREGLTGRSLWFAGEHTAPFVALGTATGAYWSGEAVGKRITEAYGVVVENIGSPVEARDIGGPEGPKEFNARGFADKTFDH